MGPGYTDKMKGPENKNKVGGPPLSRPLSNGPPSTQSRPDQVKNVFLSNYDVDHFQEHKFA